MISPSSPERLDGHADPSLATKAIGTNPEDMESFSNNSCMSPTELLGSLRKHLDDGYTSASLPSMNRPYRSETGVSGIDFDALDDIDADDSGTMARQCSNIEDIFSDTDAGTEPDAEVSSQRNLLLAFIGDLNLRYGDETFQAQLKDLVEKQCRKLDKKVEAGMSHVDGRGPLVLKVQKQVLAKYGYAGSKLGLHKVKLDLIPYEQDQALIDKLDEMDRFLFQPDGCSINHLRDLAALNSQDIDLPSQSSESESLDGDTLDLPIVKAPVEIVAKEQSLVVTISEEKQNLLDLWSELLEAYKSSEFQEQLQKLITKSTQRIGKPIDGRMSHVEGRDKLCFSVQREILPKYGFLPSKIGIYGMSVALASYSKDWDMIQKMDEMDEALRMVPKTTLTDICTIAALVSPSC